MSRDLEWEALQEWAEEGRRHDRAVYEACEPLKARIAELHEKLAAAYIELSGKTEHASDCATSNAPAKEPGPCDCGPVDRCDCYPAVKVELAMCGLANEDAASEWVEGFDFARQRALNTLRPDDDHDPLADEEARYD